MAAALVASDAHLAHDGLVEVARGRAIPCFESPARAVAIRDALTASGACDLVAPDSHGREPILAVHSAVLVDLVEHAWDDALAAGHDPAGPLIPDTFLLREYAGDMALAGRPLNRRDRLGAHCFDTATPIVAGTATAAFAAVDIALTAMDRVLAGDGPSYALCRPPGHHAARDLIGGYCYFNNAAIVAQALRDRGAERVAILDVDFHHGNGTQQLFWAREDVAYVSLHGDPAGIYPHFSGYPEERGALEGEGFTLNLPLPPGTDGDAYLASLAVALDFIAAFGPDAPLVVSLGFDTHRADPIGNLHLVTGDYARIGASVAELGLPTVVVQEGGYAIDVLGASAVAFMDGLTGG